MPVTRREFLMYGATTGAAFAVPHWLQKTVKNSGPEFFPRANQPATHSKNMELFVPAMCDGCGAGCMVKARVIDGCAVGIYGHVSHPLTRGALCPKAPALLQEVYHPDRIPQPMQRIGKRGQDDWKFITWDAALSQLTDRLKKLRQAGNSYAVAILDGSRPGLQQELWERFATLYGTPNHIQYDWIMGQYPVDAFRAMLGTDQIAADIAHSRYVLSFGLDWLQSSPSPVESSRAFSQIRRGDPNHRGHVIQIESRLSMTGGKADQWIPVNPGTEGLVALGIAAAILQDKLYNRASIGNAKGFDEWSQFVTTEFAPAAVAKTTGVSAATITSVARDFARQKRAVALCGRDDMFKQLAVIALNALVGNIGQSGGWIAAATPGSTLGSVQPQDSTGRLGLGKPRLDRRDGVPAAAEQLAQQLPDHINGKAPYALDTLIVTQCNPLFTSPDPKRWQTALDAVPFIVSLSPFMDDTTRYADLILPTHTTLEAWRHVPAVSGDGVQVVGVAKPVISPVYKTQDEGDLLLQIARGVGGAVKSGFPWASYSAIIKDAASAAYQSGHTRPLILSPADAELLDYISGFDDYWDAVTGGGGWTVTSKSNLGVKGIDLCPQLLKTAYEGMPSHSAGAKPSADRQYPLQLCIFTPLPLLGATGAHLPYLDSNAGPQLKEQWETWAEINPSTAGNLGISDGDMIWVESSVGRIKARARWFAGAMPQTVNIPCGFGHTGYGRWADGLGANPLELVAHVSDPTTALPLWHGQPVRIYSA